MSNLRIFVSITIAIIFFSCKKDSVTQPLGLIQAFVEKYKRRIKNDVKNSNIFSIFILPNNT